MLFYRKVKKSLNEDFKDLEKHDVKNLVEMRDSSVVKKIANTPWKIVDVQFELDNYNGGMLYSDERGYGKFVNGLRFRKGYAYSNYSSVFNSIQENLNVGMVYQEVLDANEIGFHSDKGEPYDIRDLHNIFGGHRNLLSFLREMGFDEEESEDYLADVEDGKHKSYFECIVMCWSPELTHEDWDEFKRNYRARDLL